MGRQGSKITPEESIKIMELLEKGFTPRAMSPIVKRSANSIYTHLRAEGIDLPKKSKYHPPRTWELPEEADYSKLPEDVLFNYKNFPSF